MKIKKTYKEFIKESNEYIDEKKLKDVFIDLLDMDFTWKVIEHNEHREKWYIDIRRSIDSNYGYIESDGAYGITNLEPMKIDISKVLDVLDDAKETLKSMDYTVGYEMEFHFNDQTQFFISCHIQHNDTIENDEDDNDHGNDGGLLRW